MRLPPEAEDTCMCGCPMNAHSIGSGHTPISMAEYYRDTKRNRGMSIKPVFAWFDLWIGAFWDRKKRKLYILPLPCIGVVISFRGSGT